MKKELKGGKHSLSENKKDRKNSHPEKKSQMSKIFKSFENKSPLAVLK